MDTQRGRSPSGGHQHIRNHSPSPHSFGDGMNGLGIALDSTSINNHQFQDNYNSNNNLPTYVENNDFMNQNQSFSQPNLTETAFDPNQTQDFPQFKQEDFPQFKQEDQTSPFSQTQQPNFTQDLLGANLSSNFNEDFSLYSNPTGQNEQFEQSYFMTELASQQGNTSINPAELNMSSPAHTPTPPGLLQPDSRSPSSAHQSPSFNQAPFQPSPGHSRHASLGPESAALSHNPGDWSMMPPQFTTHRRTPSEYSDISSAHHSPNLGHHDSFETIDQQHSPMQHPQDSIYQDVLAIGSFSLSDTQIGHPSPGHSPAMSPRLGPQHLPSTMEHQNSFMLNVNTNNFDTSPGMYSHNPESFPQMQHNSSVDMGQAQQMVPPEINVEFAPASRQNSFEPPKPAPFDQDALTPPDRGRRRRAVSDPYSPSSSSRPHTPSHASPEMSSSLSPNHEPSRSLSPNDRSGAASPGRRRQSTSSLPNRDYILGLADPDYQAASNDPNAKRVQKHPATFQCSLCPKRFTRAYNLRSHLRTHTDERPFVCTVCGKAFARQHDRKRHEGLHSGEKKFVCKGELKQGGGWGCGRRFARADALGRHFRSEAGRICIKPLLDEEALERQRVWREQRMQDMHMHQSQPASQENHGLPMDTTGNYGLPAALLAQYPALATLSWSAQGDNNMEDDPSGRSSFDASGSEYYDEGGDDGYLSGGPGPVQQHGYSQQQQQHAQMSDAYNGYSSDMSGR